MQKSCMLLTMGLLTVIIIQSHSVCLLFGEHWDIVERRLNKDVTSYKILTQ